jgi:hypothetical protein
MTSFIRTFTAVLLSIAVLFGSSFAFIPSSAAQHVMCEEDYGDFEWKDEQSIAARITHKAARVDYFVKKSAFIDKVFRMWALIQSFNFKRGDFTIPSDPFPFPTYDLTDVMLMMLGNTIIMFQKLWDFDVARDTLRSTFNDYLTVSSAADAAYLIWQDCEETYRGT